MDKKDSFGNGASKELTVGDIVEWARWDSENEQWAPHYGLLINMKNEFRSNRLVSISKVIPLDMSGVELEFFTITLRKLSSSLSQTEASLTGTV